jgi:hypothetical protein
MTRLKNPADNPDRVCATGDPERFFPDPGDLVSIKAAQAECLRCCVIEDCLRWTLKAERGTASTSRAGIFAATTPSQRAKLEQRITGRQPQGGRIRGRGAA